MTEIKRRRLEELEVACRPGTKVGEYVPFYFCYRSIMLYLLYRGDHPDLSYRGGQMPILHLEADLHSAIRWANAEGGRWSFSNGNAGSRYTPFFCDPVSLEELNWEAIAQTDWRDSFVKERKQSEFLVERSFPWQLVERIGVFDSDVAASVRSSIQGARHTPAVSVMRNWYY
jgi:hypothetical protein